MDPQLTPDEVEVLKLKIAGAERQPGAPARDWARLEGGPLDGIRVGVNPKATLYWGWVVRMFPLTTIYYVRDAYRRGVYTFEGYAHPGAKESGHADRPR